MNTVVHIYFIPLDADVSVCPSVSINSLDSIMLSSASSSRRNESNSIVSSLTWPASVVNRDASTNNTGTHNTDSPHQ